MPELTPIARQMRSILHFHRRDLLVAAAALPAAVGAVPAQAGEIAPSTMEFRLSADGRNLHVRETPARSFITPAVDWFIPAEAFGPAAWFTLARPTVGADQFRLFVREAVLGAQQNLTVLLLFRREFDRWSIAFASDAWGGLNRLSGGVSFARFVGPEAELPVLAISRDLAEPALGRLFQGRLGIQSGCDRFEITLDRDLIWTLRGEGVVALAGSVTVVAVQFGWGTQAASDAGPARSFFFGRAPAGALRLRGAVRLGDPAGHAVTATPRQGGAMTLDLSVAGATQKARVVLALSMGEGSVEVVATGSERTGPVPASSMMVTETALPHGAAGTIRTVLWGDAFGAGRAAPDAPDAPAEITTSIGLLTVGAASKEALPKESPSGPDQAGSARSRSDRDRLLQIANGDRSGAREPTVFAVADRGGGAGSVRRIQIDLSMYRAGIGPVDTSFSSLTFDTADLRLSYEDGRSLLAREEAEAPRAAASSWVWVGPRDGAPAAELDLSRATLRCARDYDLMQVRLRFFDLILAFQPEPVVKARHEACGARADPCGEVIDDRPTLVVEFDPQHVMEEAVFRPEPPPLPDAPPSGEDWQAFLTTLAATATVEARTSMRAGKLKQKEAASPTFKAFVDQYVKQPKWAALPVDQQVYIGPFALDPDAMAVARAAQLAMGRETTDAAIEAARQAATAFREKAVSRLLPVSKELDPAIAWQNALRNETIFEQQSPVYRAFRDFWRDQVTRLVSGAPAGDNAPTLPQNDLTLRALLPEYVLTGNRPAQYPPESVVDGTVANWVKARFVDFAMGRELLQPLMAARLSETSRLAFRINCQPASGLEADVAGLSGWSRAGPMRPGDGHAGYAPIPFTFEKLTDWSRHEMAVTRRAQRLFKALPSGLLPPLGTRAPSVDDLEILDFQLRAAPGSRPGQCGTARSTNAADRFSQIRATLAVQPTPLETRIELPARLALSPAQDAVWLNNRRLLRGPAKMDGLAEGEKVLASSQVPSPVRRLWSARLVTEEVVPNVRAVGSPDLRPGALGEMEPAAPAGAASRRLPGHGAPPRGPWAPWFIGPEQLDGVTLTADAAQPGTPDTCSPDPVKRSVLGLIRFLCDRAVARKGVAASDFAVFRTSLDANDRHQLVLQSSAYGLPVIAAKGAGENADVQRAGQITPGAALALIDASDEQAIYRPIPLAVSELSLTALGGSMLHDTSFVPAVGAFDLWGRRLFDGFSIERYQHDIVLGRDIRVEVVYKGYLMPFCHRASLVKLTERTFLRVSTGEIKAVLRQRMFLRIAQPLANFPLVGQPHQGRLWCGKSVRINTVRTPDLLDPTSGTELSTDGPENLNGRIYLGGEPGLAFWPRTDITESGLVRFDIDIDGAQASMPMLFVESIAASGQKALAAACDHFNAEVAAPWKQELEMRRTLSLGGQKLRFAPETKAGDTSFATDRVVVRAHGGLVPDGSKWTEGLTDFQTDAGLVGADQPSFYPGMEFATIRIDSVERLTGRAHVPVSVQYDGYYVHNGFGAVNDTATASDPDLGRNVAEVFLNLHSVIPLDMASNGDRAAAIGRPNSNVVALSRSRGPLGASGMVSWYPAQGAPLREDVDEVARRNDKQLAIAKLPFEEGLVTLVATYNRTSTEASAPAEQTKELAAAPAKDPPKLTMLQDYFSGDAKLLGVITLKDLLRLLDFAGAEIPALKEAIDYGTGALNSANAALQGLAAGIRTRVLEPLRAAVGRLAKAWADAGQALNREDPGVNLNQVFPEVWRGLAELRSSLDAAIATEDPLLLQPKLAEVYASGQLLAHDLGAIASHPAARIEQALIGDLRKRAEPLFGIVDEVKGTVAKLQAFADAFSSPEAAAATIKAWLDRELPRDNSMAVTLPLAFPVPDLLAIAGRAAALDPVADKILLDALKAVQDEIAEAPLDSRSALLALADGTVRKALGAPGNPVGDYVDGVRQRTARAVDKLSDAMKPFSAAVATQVDAAAQAYLDELAQSYLPVQTIRDEAAQIEQWVDAANDLAKAVRDHKPEGFFRALSALMQLVVGVDVAALLLAWQTTLAKRLADQANAMRTALPIPQPDDPAKLRAEAAACAADQMLPPPGGGSTALTRAIGAALTSLADSEAKLKPLEQPLRPVKSSYDQATAGIAGYRNTLQQTYCDIVTLTIGAADLTTLAAPTDSDTLAAYAQLLARLRAAGSKLATDLSTFVALPGLAIAALLAAAASSGVNIDPADAAALSTAAVQAEGAVATALTGLCNAAIGLIKTSAALAAGQEAALRADIGKLLESADELGIRLDDDTRHQLLDSLSRLGTDLDRSAGIVAIPEQTTLAGLLQTQIMLSPNQITVGQFFAAGGAKDSFATIQADLRDAEAGFVAALAAVPRALKGLPPKLRQSAERAVIASGLIDALAGITIRLRNLRYRVLTEADKQSLFRGSARRTLLVRPDPALGGGACPPDNPNAPLEGLLACDRLAQEDDLLAAAKAADPDKFEALLPRLRAYCANLAAGRGAGQLLAKQFEGLAEEVVRGKVLALVDFGTFRAAIEDALAGLVPTQAVLSYDFSSHIAHSPQASDIFQPQLGAEFGIAVRNTTNLLQPERSSFSARAHLGPFDVQLIGGIVDALRLSFGGAAFEAVNGAKPRFDVSYRDFTIGKDLEFAQELQSYLTPKDGNGLYIRPMSTGLGIEAGYGIDLGILSVGETSFFNVKLAVAAELPFDDQGARFKVGLGTPLAPFTMSVLPFAGSGYFAVIADARGVIGFEASFEFGGGGSLNFGPLSGQARIQVGVFVRLLKLRSGRTSTTLSGTFFAGGSASLWIFHFSTALSVRLGTSEGGSMYGEALYTFSFSIGFASYDFAVTVYKRQAAVGQSQSAALDVGGGTQFAANTYPRTVSDVALPLDRATVRAATGKPRATGQSDWLQYREYFDLSLLPKAGNPEYP